MGAISNEWKGAIKSNVILKTTAYVWSKPDYDLNSRASVCNANTESPLVVAVLATLVRGTGTLELANYLSFLD